MEKITAVEENISHSFQRVKADIIRLQDEFMQLRETQIRLLRKLARLEEKKTEEKKPIKTTEVKKTKKSSSTKKKLSNFYIASKEGKKFHLFNCPYAQNIKPKTKIKFKTKEKALNQGYKPCSCIK